MFIKNKYYNWYFNIISNAKSRSLTGYVEKHHIIPKSLGGNNNITNLVSLTAREHFICHRLLVKFTEGENKRKMAYAIRRMITGINRYHQRYTLSSILYSRLREEINKLTEGRKHTDLNKKKISDALKGRKFSKETLFKMREAKLGKAKPEYIAKKLRTLRKGRTNTDTHKEKCSRALKGRKISDEAKKRMSINHADFSGSNNPRAKTWLITDPNGNSTIINGTMNQFCTSHNLPASVMRAIGRTGIIPKSGRCVGWQVQLLS